MPNNTEYDLTRVRSNGFEEVLLNYYTLIRSWQTRVLRLFPADAGRPLEADLLVADIVSTEGLVLHDEQMPIYYEAISYTWGEPKFTKAITCNGQDYRITPTLHDALQALRLPDRERYLWADALCIDQSSDEEKSFQVRNMFSIFRKAEAVLVWLGSESTLYNLNSTVWAKRAWVQQEVFVARHVEVWTPSEHYALADHKGRLSIQMAGEDVIHEIDKQRYLEGRSHDVQTCDCHSNKSGAGVSYRIECVLHRHRRCQATNTRDRIYALLAMSRCRSEAALGASRGSRTLQLRVDYSRSVSQVFSDVTRYILNRDRNLDILLSFVPDKDQLLNIDLPSWTPDWRIFQSHPSQARYSGDGDWALPWQDDDECDWSLPWQEDNQYGVLKLRGAKLAEVITVEHPDTQITWHDFAADPRFPCGPNKLSCFSHWYPEQIFDFGPRDRIDFLPKGWLTEWICWTVGDARPGDWLTLAQGTDWLLVLRPCIRRSGEKKSLVFRFVGAAFCAREDVDVGREKAHWPYPGLVAGLHERTRWHFRGERLQDFNVL